MDEVSRRAEEEENKQLVRRWLKLYNDGRDQQACDIYTDDVVCREAMTPSLPLRGRDAMLRGALEFRRSEPEYQCHPREVIAEGDRVVMTWDVKMSKAQLEVLGVFRIHSGKIVELQEYFTGDGYRLFAESEPPVEERN